MTIVERGPQVILPSGLPREAFLRNHTFYTRQRRETIYPDGWDEQYKAANFNHLFEIYAKTGQRPDRTTCLDMGCGTGDLYRHYRSYGGQNYRGIDIYSPAIADAKQKYPSGNFRFGDMFEIDESGEQFDFAFASGINTAYVGMDKYDFIRAMVERTLPRVTRGFAFNFLYEVPELPDTTLWSFDPERIAQICAEAAGGQWEQEINPDENTGLSTVLIWKAPLPTSQ